MALKEEYQDYRDMTKYEVWGRLQKSEARVSELKESLDKALKSLNDCKMRNDELSKKVDAWKLIIKDFI